MVDLNIEIFESSINSGIIPENISISSIEENIKKYPAFNTIYLLQARTLHETNQDIFNRQLPIIATNVKDRAKLHDITFRPKTQSVENKPLTKEHIITHEEEQKKNTQIVEIQTEKIQTPVTIKQEDQTTSNKPENKDSDRIDALKTLQDELFGTKTKEESTNSDPKELKRIAAMKKLQDELFKQKIEKKTNIGSKQEFAIPQKDEIIISSKNFNTTSEIDKTKEIIHSNSKIEIKEVVTQVKEEEAIEEEQISENFDNKKEIAQPEDLIQDLLKHQKEIVEQLEEEDEETIPENKLTSIFDNTKDDDELIPIKNIKIELKEVVQQEQNAIPSNELESSSLTEKAKNIVYPKEIIEELLRHQEEKVNTIISEENKFVEKESKLEFIDWLKIKNGNETVEVENIKEEIEEDIVPFERASVIEAEMHQEIKKSSDPLENFISSEILRKKKKKNKVNTVIVSETLAEILTLQQKYSEAIDVYKLLGLKYPQKSIYFAQQIEKIKNYL